MDLQEQQALAMLREGDETAFEMVFRSHYQPLCQYAYSFLNDRDEAEEVVQATFITIWEKRNAIHIESSLKSYLYRSVRNGCLNALKHVKVKNEYARGEMAGGEPIYEGVSQNVESGELEARIHEAMKSLPDQCRLVFQLSRFEELKYSEIADQLNISVKTVENHMGKALKLMRSQLKEYLPLLLLFILDQITI